jgi:hypothetical protein
MSYTVLYDGGWGKIKLLHKRTVVKYNIYSYSDVDCLKSWVLEGSNNDSDWTTLSSVSDSPAWTGYKEIDYTISTPAEYKYYRISVSDIYGTNAKIMELRLYAESDWRMSFVGDSADSNYFIWDGEGISIKGDLVIAAGDNAIYFEDSKLLLGDNKVIYDGDTVQRYIRIATAIGNVDTIVSGIGYLENSEYDIYQSIFSIQNRFADYDTPSEFVATVTDGTGTPSAVTLYFCTYNDARTNKASEVFQFLRDDDTSTSGYFNTGSAIKSVIPYWYGAVGSPTTKTPAYVSWTSADNCPFSNIWVWGFTVGEGAEYRLYVRDAGGTVRHVQFS